MAINAKDLATMGCAHEDYPCCGCDDYIPGDSPLAYVDDYPDEDEDLNESMDYWCPHCDALYMMDSADDARAWYKGVCYECGEELPTK